MLNLNKYIPTLFRIADAEGCDLGVAESKLIHCIRTGKPMHKGSNKPDGFAPDYEKLKEAYNALKMEAVTAERNTFIATWRKHYKELCSLYKAGRYQEMIDAIQHEDE